MPKENEIRERLAAYLDGTLSLGDFSGWLYREVWDMTESEPEARALAYGVLRRVAERSTAGFSEEELRNELRPLTNTVVTRVTLVPPSRSPIRTTSTGVMMEIRPLIAVGF
jgi:hypothetical protein